MFLTYLLIKVQLLKVQWIGLKPLHFSLTKIKQQLTYCPRQTAQIAEMCDQESVLGYKYKNKYKETSTLSFCPISYLFFLIILYHHLLHNF